MTRTSTSCPTASPADIISNCTDGSKPIPSARSTFRFYKSGYDTRLNALSIYHLIPGNKQGTIFQMVPCL